MSSKPKPDLKPEPKPEPKSVLVPGRRYALVYHTVYDEEKDKMTAQPRYAVELPYE